MVAKKINKIKENKSPGVDGITRRRNSFFRMERSNITLLVKKGSRNKSENY